MARKKILIVDDEEIILEMLKEYFFRNGYEIDTAINGVECLIKIKTFNPDVVLLDILMPVMDGISTLKQIKDNSTTSKIPVIMLTNFEDKEKVSEAMVAGANYYLVKLNYSPKDLGEKIEEILNKQYPNL